MRARLGAIFVVIGALALLWWAWPAAQIDTPPTEKATAPKNGVKRALPPKKRVVSAAPKKGQRLQPAQAPSPAEEAAGPGRLVIDVVDENGRTESRGRIGVSGCKSKRVERGIFEVTGEGSCVVRAGRRDGALWARSEAVEVSVQPGGEAYVQVVLRSARTGGLGVSIGHAPNGIKVLAVMPGTPAAEAGLEAGDVITEVNGLPTQGMAMQSFVQAMTGPEGTEVDFVLAFEDEEGKVEEQLSIVRSFLDRS